MHARFLPIIMLNYIRISVVKLDETIGVRGGGGSYPLETFQYREVGQIFVEIYENSGNFCWNQWKDGNLY